LRPAAFLGALLIAAAGLNAAPLLVDDFEGPPKGSRFMNVDHSGLGTQAAPVPFETAPGGALGSGSARLHGHLGLNQAPWSWVQLQLGFNPANSPTDITRYKTLRFRAKGDGNLHTVRLLKAEVTDSDQFLMKFPAGAAWAEVRLPLDGFRQAGWGKARERSFHDVTAVEFSPGANDSDFDFSVDQVELLEEDTQLKPVEFDTRGWFSAGPVDVAAKRGSALDVSAILDKPAGKYGWARARGESYRFEKAAKDVRFFGINIVAGGNFPSHAQAEAMAEQLAQMGMNITRHHHFDAPWASRNIFGKKPGSRQLDADSLERFDYLVYQLQKRGIYQYLDLLVHREPKAADGVLEPKAVVNGFKMEAEFAPDLIALQKEFTRQFLGHKNPYTGKRYGQDQAVAGMEIINEDSLFFRQASGDFAIEGRYAKLFQDRFNQWLLKAYKDRAALDLRWAPADAALRGLGDDEDPAAGTVKPVETWSAGGPWTGLSRARALDSYRFYFDLQCAYYKEMAAVVRELGYKGPLTGSNHWVGSPADLYANAAYDFLDRHAYWAHPQGGYGYDPKITWDPSPMLKSGNLGIVGELASRRVKGKPYMATEWQSCAPNDFRADGVLAMGAACALQNWSAIQFSFTHTDERDLEHFTGPLDSNTDIVTQPAMRALWPAVALALARGDIAPLQGEAWQALTPAQALDPVSGFKVGGPVILGARTGVAFGAAGPAFDPKAAGLAYSKDGWNGLPGGQVRQHPGKGLFLVDTPRTAALAGFTGGEEQSLGKLKLRLANRYAVLMASSLDGKPLEQSFHVLVTAVGNAVNEGMALTPSGNQLSRVGGPAVLVEPVEGSLRMEVAGGRRGKVWALDESGRRRDGVAARFEGGALSFDLKPGYKTLHYELALDEAAAP
jgi:hypothetical protein